jgi:transcriptional regulator with XRE-family HTH domain
MSVVRRRGGTLAPKYSPEMVVAIGRRVDFCLRRQGFRSHEEFAHAIGFPKSTLSRLMRGKIDPRVSTLDRLAAGLGMSLVEMLSAGGFEAQEPVRTPVRKPAKEPMEVRMSLKLPPDGELPDWVRELPWTRERAPRRKRVGK